jgi:cytoskeletal protein CcmA (bactofilin family)
MERPAEIGKTIVIRGEVTAREDLVISGRVEGSIRVEGHAVLINAGADVRADIDARAITVAGHVAGAVLADERIELRETSTIEGEMEAPAIKMADGAVFQGKAGTTAGAKKKLKIAS